MMGESDVIASVAGLSQRRLRRWVQSGWVLPAMGAEGPSYSEIDVARVQLIQHLVQELQIGGDAVPVVLSLLDQVYGLRQELRRLARAVEAQPDQVKQAILRSAVG